MSSETGTRYSGSVKWYNYKLLYGFITYKNDDGDFDDIFVYIKDIVSNKKNKYLNKGEYVEFNIVPCENYNEESDEDNSKASGSNQKESVPSEEHKVKAGDVTGINRGMLQHEYMSNPYIQSQNKHKSSKPNKKEGGDEEGEWKTVGKRR